MYVIHLSCLYKEFCFVYLWQAVPAELGSFSIKYYPCCAMVEYVNCVAKVELVQRKMEEALNNLNARIKMNQKVNKLI